MKLRFVFILIIFLLPACVNYPGQILFDKQSQYERVLVIDKGDNRYLRFGNPNSANQSSISLSDRGEVPAEYIRQATLGVMLTPNLNRVLMIGLGGGIFTTLLRRHFPTLHIDAVEIDPVVVEAAKRFFNVREDERFKIHVTDGAQFIRETPYIYDLIFIDAYSGEGVPEALFSQVFFNAVKSKTSATGVVVLNLFKQTGKEQAFIQVLQPRFPHIACARSSDDLNLVLFCKASHMPTRSHLIAVTKKFVADSNLKFNLGAIAQTLSLECKIRD